MKLLPVTAPPGHPVSLLESHLAWARSEFLRTSGWVRLWTEPQATLKGPPTPARVDELYKALSGLPVERTSREAARRGAEARDRVQALAALPEDLLPGALDREQLSPELIFELFSHAERLDDPAAAYGWLGHAAAVGLRAMRESRQDQAIPTYRSGLVEILSLRCKLGLDLVVPFAEIDRDAQALAYVLEEGVVDPHDAMVAWCTLGAYARARGQYSQARSLLLMADALASEWAQPHYQVLAALERTRLARLEGRLEDALAEGGRALAWLRDADWPALRRELVLELAHVATRAGEPRQAKAALGSLRRMGAPAAGSLAERDELLVPWLEGLRLFAEEDRGAAGALTEAEEAIHQKATGDAWSEFWIARIRLDRIATAVLAEEPAETIGELIRSQLGRVISLEPELVEVFSRLAAAGVPDLEMIDQAIRALERRGPWAFLLPIH